MNPLENKAFVIPAVLTSTISASISFVASLTIIVMIFWSNLKLSTIYRRLIFGLSVFDLVQSFSQIFSAVLMPKGTMWTALGNDISCSISGFISNAGVIGSVWYSLSISIYFLSIVKFEMEETSIRKHVEPFLHGLPIVYSLGTGIYILSTNYFNPYHLVCWIAPQSGDDENAMYVALALRWIVGVPILAVFVSNCIILGVMWCTVYSQSRQISQFYARASATFGHQPAPSSTTANFCSEENNRRGKGTSAEEERTPISSSLKRLFQSFRLTTDGQARRDHQSSDDHPCQSFSMPLPRLSNTSNTSVNPLVARLSRPSRGTTQMLQEISNRTTAYIIGYIMTHLFSLVSNIVIAYSSSGYPFVTVMLSRVLCPLQGFFNLLIYTYPHVLTYRRHHDETSWVRAFSEVIKSGGDSDQRQPERRKIPKGLGTRRSKFAKRRDSLRNEPVVLDVGQSFIRDVERIRTAYNHSSGDGENQQEEAKEAIGEEDGGIVNGGTHGGRDSLKTETAETASILDYGQSFVRDAEQIETDYDYQNVYF